MAYISPGGIVLPMSTLGNDPAFASAMRMESRHPPVSLMSLADLFHCVFNTLAVINIAGIIG